MIKRIKRLAASMLEQHPYGYALGVALLESHSFFLPHEADFYGIPLLVGNMNAGLFLDVGANRGHSALGFHKLLPNWRIFSIEANPLHKDRLEKLKQQNPFLSYQIAAADRESGKTVTIWTPRYGRLYCHSAAALNRSDAVRAIELAFPAQAAEFDYVASQTRTVTLDELAVVPQFVKIDIQGKEADALSGFTNTVALHRPYFLVECNLDADPVFDLMRKLNYLPVIYDPSRHRLMFLGAADRAQRNIFFVPAERTSSLRESDVVWSTKDSQADSA
jgi:FkbM family methyltransferase